ncbi:hypothetical protein CHISP_3270 [Chitinispirillum alkaliphilum]|nr:hypothetical protein CHISP_3270 [Chitinispirillum alkaliphilum]
MEWRLFFSTFALIFLAELGDKTQLASMAASAGTKSPWSVFAGAASALVVSTLVAVLVGSFLQRVAPKHLIQGVAAVLFLIFGIILLLSAFDSYKSEKSVTGKPDGLLSRTAFKAAEMFERESAQDYMALAEAAQSPRLRELLIHLAQEEQQHLSHLHNLSQKHNRITISVSPSENSIPPVQTDKTENDGTSEHVLEQAIEHEKATAQFYRALAKSSVITELRSAFILLAAEEEGHLAHLLEFRDTGKTDLQMEHEFELG